MSEQNETLFESEEEQGKSVESEDDLDVWEPVNGGSDDYNDYPLAFVNVDKKTDQVTYNVDGEDVEPKDYKGPMIVGEFKGIKDISSDSNPEPSIKVLIESDRDERTYAVNKVTALERQVEDLKKGVMIGLDFDGYVQPDDGGLPWQNWTVYRKKP